MTAARERAKALRREIDAGGEQHDGGTGISGGDDIDVGVAMGSRGGGRRAGTRVIARPTTVRCLL